MKEALTMNTFIIRYATAKDIQGMLEVFNYYIKNSFSAYLETPVGPEFFQALKNENREKEGENFPFYVIEETEEEKGEETKEEKEEEKGEETKEEKEEEKGEETEEGKTGKKKGRIVGIGALRPYFPYQNFRHTGILSYFILPEYTRKGLGSRLLGRLCQDAREKKMISLLANVSSKNEASLNFHKKHGFSECGRFKAVGTKFGEYFDVVWVQKFLEREEK